MAQRQSTYYALTISVQFIKTPSGHWSVNLISDDSVSKVRAFLPICSGDRDEQLSQRDWVELLDLLRGMLSSAIGQVIEPF